MNETLGVITGMADATEIPGASYLGKRTILVVSRMADHATGAAAGREMLPHLSIDDSLASTRTVEGMVGRRPHDLGVRDEEVSLPPIGKRLTPVVRVVWPS